MSLKANIITADERLRDRARVSGVILGPSGVGKTSLARTMDPESTLFIDGEGGTLAIQDWKGGVIDVRAMSNKLGCHPWELLRALACYFGGPDPAAKPESPYSAANYAQYCAALGDPAEWSAIKTLFWDSITVASRYSFDWAQRQPEAFSQKTGKPDMLGAYGLHGREMIAWFTQIQHMQGRNNFIVGILDKVTDDLRRVSWEPQIVGSMGLRTRPCWSVAGFCALLAVSGASWTACP
jgi:AAA domain